MNIKEKLLVMGIGVAIVSFIVTPIQSNAALQANGNPGARANIDSWLLNIRKMEETGGTLGLSDTINTTNLTSSAEQKNNIDIHMQKNTEFGAMAILSASAYGNPNVITDGQSTTGNKTGVYIKMNSEWVSGGTSDLGNGVANFRSAVGKYKNLYPHEYVAKVGDAMTETKNWHTTGGTWNWIDRDPQAGLQRACTDVIFSYQGRGDGVYAGAHEPRFSRAVVVIGNGF
ncbi:MAG: hypothetical protein HFJ27_01075 [Clostridia bacterium]|nr:hypothetical protein [Clostridia bacterium]